MAEALGADLAISLYERYSNVCQSNGTYQLPLDRIQGDIKPLIHLQFQGRFRRNDLIPIIDRVHRKRSRLAPDSHMEYRPRETNFIADFLAGEGSRFLIDKVQRQGFIPPEVQEITVDPPYELLLKNHASIMGPHGGGKFVLTLQLPSCNFEQLTRYAQWQQGAGRRQLCCIAVSTAKCSQPMVVEYVAAAEDGTGRIYARQVCAQQLPKELRTLVYRKSHKEVDILPPIRTLRGELDRIWREQTDRDLSAEIKLFFLRIINSGIEASLAHWSAEGLRLTSMLCAVAYELDTARAVVTSHFQQKLRPLLPCTATNRHFHTVEALEFAFMHCFLQEVQMCSRNASITWLHDGIWISDFVPDSDIRAAERIAVQSLFPDGEDYDPVVRITDLREQYELVAQKLPSTPPPPLYSPLPTRPPRFTKAHPKARFVAKRLTHDYVESYPVRLRKRHRKV